MKTFALFSVLLSGLLISFSTLAAPAVQIGSVERGLYNRERLYTDFLQVTRDLEDARKQEALNLWARAMKQKDPHAFRGMQAKLSEKIRNRKLVQLITHYSYTKQTVLAQSAVEYYFFSLASWIFEMAGQPLLSGTSIQQNAAQMAPGGFAAVEKLRTCLKGQSDLTGFGTCIARPELQSLLDFALMLNAEKSYVGPSGAVGFEGVIGGNKIELLTQNRQDVPFVEALAPLTNKIQNLKSTKTGKAYAEMSIVDYRQAMATRADVDQLFTKAEGFPTELNDVKSADFHPIFAPLVSSGEKNIYGEFYSAISEAKESIFFNVYFFGGSAGVTLAKKLIQAVQKNPALRVFIVTDRWNTMSYSKELNVAYNFLRAYAENFPEDRIVVMPPNIFMKRGSLPSIVDLLADDDLVRDLINSPVLKAKLSVYPKAKSDHSKVLVIDGLNPKTATAFVGSKNMTDTSGGVAFDEVAKIQGPAVSVILDSYYHDLALALELEHEGAAKKFAGYDASNRSYIEKLAKAIDPSATTVKQRIQSLLKPLDVLGRSNDGYLEKFKVPVENKGTALIQVAQNNAYGTVRSAALQDIQTILSAKRQIIVDDQFLFDPDIVDALQLAARQNPHLKIYIIVSSLADLSENSKPFAHVPNITFVPDLTKYAGIQMKWNKTPKNLAAALMNANRTQNLNLSPEFHLKSISIDGIEEANARSCGDAANSNKVTAADLKRVALSVSGMPVLITGSANKDNLTMMGGFREYQVAIYGDKEATAKHDCMFWSRWNDPDHSEKISLSSMNLPAELKAKGLSDEVFLSLLQRMLRGAYKMKVD